MFLAESRTALALAVRQIAHGNPKPQIGIQLGGSLSVDLRWRHDDPGVGVQVLVRVGEEPGRERDAQWRPLHIDAKFVVVVVVFQIANRHWRNVDDRAVRPAQRNPVKRHFGLVDLVSAGFGDPAGPNRPNNGAKPRPRTIALFAQAPVVWRHVFGKDDGRTFRQRNDICGRALEITLSVKRHHVADNVDRNWRVFGRTVFADNQSRAQLTEGIRWLANELYHPANFGARLVKYIDRLKFQDPAVAKQHKRNTMRSVDRDTLSLISDIPKLDGESAKMWKQVTALLPKNPGATVPIMEALIRYQQLRYMYETGHFWDTPMARPEAQHAAAG